MPSAIELLEESGDASTATSNDNNNTAFITQTTMESNPNDITSSEPDPPTAFSPGAPGIWPPKLRRRVSTVQDAASDNSEPDDEYYTSLLGRRSNTPLSRSSSPKIYAVSVMEPKLVLLSSSNDEDDDQNAVHFVEEDVDARNAILLAQGNVAIELPELAAAAAVAASPPSPQPVSPPPPPPALDPLKVQLNYDYVPSNSSSSLAEEPGLTNNKSAAETIAITKAHACHPIVTGENAFSYDGGSDDFDGGDDATASDADDEQAVDDKERVTIADRHHSRIHLLIEALKAAEDARRQLDFKLARAKGRVRFLRARLVV
jgi:hypothetical protein